MKKIAQNSFDTLKDLEGKDIVKKSSPSKGDAGFKEVALSPILKEPHGESIKPFAVVKCDVPQQTKAEECRANADNIRLRSEIDMLKITLAHFKEDLQVVSDGTSNRRKAG